MITELQEGTLGFVISINHGPLFTLSKFYLSEFNIKDIKSRDEKKLLRVLRSYKKEVEAELGIISSYIV